MADGIDALFRTFKADQRTGRLIKFGAGLGLLVFGFWTVGFLGIPMERLLGMFGPLGAMLANRVFPPDLVFATEWKILLSVVETIEMSLLGAFYGTVVTIPLAWWAAWNITPSRTVLYPLARAVIVFCRSLPTVSARTPAKGPNTKMATSRRPSIRVGRDRQKTMTARARG